MKPTHIINATAPTRICDNGGWTDTWFAEYGNIFNIAVSPLAHVQIEVYARNQREAHCTIHAENFGDNYVRNLGTDWQKHALIEAAIDRIGVPADKSIHIHLYSDAPPGASMGTSAAVTVALIGALDALTEGRLTAHEIALQAQKVETEDLDGQCGIQDQLAAAYGGINYIEMFNYPYASVSPVQLKPHVWQELERRLLLIFVGKSHSSTQVHEQVIKSLEDFGPTEPRLERLRKTAVPARNALINGDFAQFGQALIANTNAQANLHPDLISPEAQQIINIAQAHGALGWKVNGAGGDGGSVAILCNEHAQTKRNLQNKIASANPLFKPLPVTLNNTGLTIW